ncbi:MAG: hypothetical protein ACREC6_05840 [Hyphomicrobiaceae bacterium]
MDGKYAIYLTVSVMTMTCIGSSVCRPQGTDAEYNPSINPQDFVPHVAHKYFTLKPGTKFIYEKKTLWNTERIEVVVTKETKQVMGVATTVVWDRVWQDGKLIEDTKDWYAQDKDGNVWYFGEAVNNYRNEKLKDHAGSWEAGVNGAKPGLIMPKDFKVGDTYRQEYAKGVAEDMGTVVAVSKKITVPYGSFDDCVQIQDWSKIERTANEHKYYCSGVGFAVLEESAWFGMGLLAGKTELIGVTTE